MPRYLIGTGVCTPKALRRATALLDSRFPEISLLSHAMTGDSHVSIRCHAPSAEHARRWLRNAEIELRSIRVISDTPDDE